MPVARHKKYGEEYLQKAAQEYKLGTPIRSIQKKLGIQSAGTVGGLIREGKERGLIDEMRSDIKKDVFADECASLTGKLERIKSYMKIIDTARLEFGDEAADIIAFLWARYNG